MLDQIPEFRPLVPFNTRGFVDRAADYGFSTVDVSVDKFSEIDGDLLNLSRKAGSFAITDKDRDCASQEMLNKVDQAIDVLAEYIKPGSFEFAIKIFKTFGDHYGVKPGSKEGLKMDAISLCEVSDDLMMVAFIEEWRTRTYRTIPLPAELLKHVQKEMGFRKVRHSNMIRLRKLIISWLNGNRSNYLPRA